MTIKASSLLLTVLSLLIISGASMTGQAQSGRRAPKPTRQVEQIEATPASKPEETQPAKTTAAAAKTTLLVASYNWSQRSGGSAITIFFNFNKRLNESASYAARSIGSMKREEAERRAKAEKDVYTIFLEVEPDVYQQGTLVMNSPDLIVRYYILAPLTGKVKAKGKVYYQAMSGPRARTSGDLGDPSIKITAEAAGIEAADLVLDWFRFTAGK
jgi:hypothetical protein